MKSPLNFCNSGIKYFLIAPLFLILSCSTSEKVTEIPNELIGTWKSSDIKITVRKKDDSGYNFYSGNGAIVVDFKKDEAISGSIGTYQFSNGILTKGSIYKVVCDSAGVLFNDDPVQSKEISLWFHKITQDTIEGEIRLTQGGGKFPMASFSLTKD